MTSHIDDHLSAYLDEELDGLTRQRISAHLGGCDECSARLAELAALDDLSREAEVDAPEGYFEILPGAIRKRLPDRTAPKWVVPRWTWAAAAAALIVVLAPLTIEQGPEIAPRAPLPRSAAQRPAAPTATLAKQDDAQQPVRQLQVLDEAVAGAAGDRKKELREQRPSAAGRKDALKSKLAAAAPAAPPPEPTVDQSMAQPKARERAVAARKRPAAATPAPPTGQSPGFAAAASSAPAEPEDVAEIEAMAFEEEGVETREQDALMRTSGKVSTQGRRENIRARAAVGGITTAEALRAPADADTIEGLRLERKRLRLEVRDQPDAGATDTRMVRIIELGAQIYLSSRDKAAFDTLRQDARHYLRRPDAEQHRRVESLLASLPPTR